MEAVPDPYFDFSLNHPQKLSDELSLVHGVPNFNAA